MFTVVHDCLPPMDTNVRPVLLLRTVRQRALLTVRPWLNTRSVRGMGVQKPLLG